MSVFLEENIAKNSTMWNLSPPFLVGEKVIYNNNQEAIVTWLGKGKSNLHANEMVAGLILVILLYF